MKKVVKKEKRDNSNQKMRDSNFELMRIISMFMIVVTHIIGHGYVVENCDGLTETAVALLKCLLYVHVNSFVLFTGYYQCKGKFKLQKIFSLNIKQETIAQNQKLKLKKEKQKEKNF